MFSFYENVLQIIYLDLLLLNFLANVKLKMQYSRQLAHGCSCVKHLSPVVIRAMKSRGKLRFFITFYIRLYRMTQKSNSYNVNRLLIKANVNQSKTGRRNMIVKFSEKCFIELVSLSFIFS